MNKFVKIASATAVAGVMALALATPSEARNGRNAAAIGGFVAGAAVGAAVAGSANNGYYSDNGYYSEPSYAYEPAPAYYDQDYAYAPAPRYYRTAPRQGCGQGSPSSVNYRPCNNQ